MRLAVTAGSVIAEFEEDESPALYYDLRAEGFPVALKRSQSTQRVTLESWEGLWNFCERRPADQSEVSWLRNFFEVASSRPLMLASIVPDSVVHYLACYAQATAKYTKGFLFPGSLEDQPAVLLEAFSVIEGEMNAQERKRHQRDLAEARKRAGQK